MRYPQWLLLLVAVLGILSGSRSSRGLEAFADGVGRRSTRCWTSISSVGRWMPPSHTSTAPRKSDDYNKARLKTFGDLFQAWMISQIADWA